MENKYLTAQRTMNLPQRPPMPMAQQVMMKQQMLAGFGAPKAAPSKKTNKDEKKGLSKYFTKEKISSYVGYAVIGGVIAHGWKTNDPS